MDAKKVECLPSSVSAGQTTSSSTQKNDLVADDTKEKSKTIKSHTGTHERKVPVDGPTEGRIVRQHVESGLSVAASSINPEEAIKAARDAQELVQDALSYSRKFDEDSSDALGICRTSSSYAAQNKSAAANVQLMEEYRSMGYQWLKISNDIGEAIFEAQRASNKGIDCANGLDDSVSELVEAIETKPDAVADAQGCVIDAAERAKTAADDIYKKHYELLVALKTCWECASYKAICYPKLPGEKICECTFGRWMWLIATCFFLTLGSVLISLPHILILNATAYYAVMDVGIPVLILCVLIGLSILLKPRWNRRTFMHKRSKKLAMCKRQLQYLAKYGPEIHEATNDDLINFEDELPQDCNLRQPLL